MEIVTFHRPPVCPSDLRDYSVRAWPCRQARTLNIPDLLRLL